MRFLLDPKKRGKEKEERREWMGGRMREEGRGREGRRQEQTGKERGERGTFRDRVPAPFT